MDDIRVAYEDYGLTMDELEVLLGMNLEQLDQRSAAIAAVRRIKVQELLRPVDLPSTEPSI